MIRVTMPDGAECALNADLIERVEPHGSGSLLTMVDGTKYAVAERVDEVVDRVRDAKADVVARSSRLDPRTSLRVLHGEETDRRP